MSKHPISSPESPLLCEISLLLFYLSPLSDIQNPTLRENKSALAHTRAALVFTRAALDFTRTAFVFTRAALVYRDFPETYAVLAGFISVLAKINAVLAGFISVRVAIKKPRQENAEALTISYDYFLAFFLPLAGAWGWLRSRMRTLRNITPGP